MPKITFIGAGSVVFTKELLGAILSFPELHGSAIALHDIDPRRLDAAERMARWISGELGAGVTVQASLDRREALEGADYVVNTIAVGGMEATRLDHEIPARYGIHQVIGDTLGIGGISRAARTIPVALEIARDMESLSPNAILLNYANPMSMVTWAVYRATSVPVVGLCHSIYWTSVQLAGYIGAPFEEISFDGAGINHQAWVLRFERSGQDAYPALREAIKQPEIWRQDPVRFEMFRRLGYFVTESSMHNAEYTSYFLKRPDLIERFQVPVGFYLKELESLAREFEETYDALLEGKPLPIEPSPEYAPQIIHSMETGQVRKIYGNVENAGLIENLPQGCCVEVPCVVDETGLHPCYVGELPPHLAAINRVSVGVQELTVRAVLEGRREHLYHAAMLDPLVSALLDLDQVWALVDELLDAHGEYIPEPLIG
ncbi:MAG TPA: alpha-glucosidase/alpha-galactosidase [Anaerolineales bacterium]|nr:alpha-glucosidase/alpha-galactosidase [Anaerolineae bacterium]HIQ01789.1 alpha-glucosidase/alpha-galactosidase [Anaerolineales bacterium]